MTLAGIPEIDQQVTDLVNWLSSIQSDGKPRDQYEFQQGPGSITPGQQEGDQ